MVRYETLSSSAIGSGITLPTVAALHHLLHEAVVVVLGFILVFTSVEYFMPRHGLNKMVNNFVGNKRVSKIKFSDVWLFSVSDWAKQGDVANCWNIPCHLRPHGNSATLVRLCFDPQSH